MVIDQMSEILAARPEYESRARNQHDCGDDGEKNQRCSEIGKRFDDLIIGGRAPDIRIRESHDPLSDRFRRVHLKRVADDEPYETQRQK